MTSQDSVTVSLVVAFVGIAAPLAYWYFTSRLLHRSDELQPVIKTLDNFIAESTAERRVAEAAPPKPSGLKPAARVRKKPASPS